MSPFPSNPCIVPYHLFSYTREASSLWFQYECLTDFRVKEKQKSKSVCRFLHLILNRYSLSISKMPAIFLRNCVHGTTNNTGFIKIKYLPLLSPKIINLKKILFNSDLENILLLITAASVEFICPSLRQSLNADHTLFNK